MSIAQEIAQMFVTLRVDSSKAEGEVRAKGSSLGKTFAQYFGAAAFGAALGKAIQSGSRLEQSVGAIDAVFGKSGKTIDAWAKGAAKSMGLSEAAAREALSLIGAQLKNFGYSTEEALSKGQELVGLGADLAATFGGTTVDAVEALTAALRGETDPIERYGVSLTQARIAAKAVEMGLIDTASQMDANVRATAALALITDQTKDAQGQFARELDTVAGKQQVAAAEAENSAASLGQALAPAYERIVEIVTQAVEIFGELPAPLQLAVVALAGLVILSGPLSAFKDIVIATKQAMTGMSVNVAGLGAAVGVASGIIYAATKIYRFYADEKARAKKETDDFVAALAAEAGGSKDAVNQLIATKLGGEAVTSAVKKMGLGWTAVTEYIKGNTSPEFDFLRQQFKGSRTEIDELGPALQYLQETYGLTEAEAGALVHALNETRAAYKGAADQAEQQAIIIDALGQETEEAAEKMKHAATTSDTWTGALDHLHDAIQDNADEAQRFLDIMGDILDPFVDAEEAARNWEQALDDIAESFKENGATLDINTQAGRDNREEIQKGADAIRDKAAALVEQGARTEDVQWALKAMTEQLHDQLTALGLSDEAADEYLTTLGLTPDNINTTVQLLEIDKRKAELEDLLTQLDGVDEGATAEIKTLLEDGKLDEAERRIREVAGAHNIDLVVRVTGPRNIVVVPTNNGYTIQRYDVGGYIGEDQLAMVHRNEVVLPLGKPSRMRQLANDPRVYEPLMTALGADGASTGGGLTGGGGGSVATTANYFTLVGWSEQMMRDLEQRLKSRERGRR